MGSIRDLMTVKPRTVKTGDSIVDAAKLMRGEDAGIAPIVDGERLVGVLTDRDIAVRGTTGRSGVGDGGVQQGARELCADRVVHLQPAAVEHGLCGRRETQQPGGRAAEKRRALTEHLHPAIDLNGEPVG